MWIIIYGRHFLYLKYKEYRYETSYAFMAFVMYTYYYLRYSMSIYPIKYLKIYRISNNLITNYKIVSEGYSGKSKSKISKMSWRR